MEKDLRNYDSSVLDAITVLFEKFQSTQVCEYCVPSGHVSEYDYSTLY